MPLEHDTFHLANWYFIVFLVGTSEFELELRDERVEGGIGEYSDSDFTHWFVILTLKDNIFLWRDLDMVFQVDLGKGTRKPRLRLCV